MRSATRGVARAASRAIAIRDERRISSTRAEAASRKRADLATPAGSEGRALSETTLSNSARSAGSESRRRAGPASPDSASSRAAKPWNVRISGNAFGPSARLSRSRNSPTARRENVSSKISDAATPSASSASQRATITRVFPDPGTASTSRLPPRKSTAACCRFVSTSWCSCPPTKVAPFDCAVVMSSNHTPTWCQTLGTVPRRRPRLP
jgi:hypothetical protein